METNFNFKSQICTTREQSERLISLGLKKETADMHYSYFGKNSKGEAMHYSEPFGGGPFSFDSPAWSLHRLIDTLPLLLREGDNYSLIFDIHRDWVAYMAYASGERNPYNRYLWESQNTNIYDAFIDCIEWLIKEGYFNKEYLV